MIDYFEQLIPEEQEGITEVIQTLFRQTFLLERKFDRRLGRMRIRMNIVYAVNILNF